MMTDPTQQDEALHRAQKLDVSLTVTVLQDGDPYLHLRTYTPGKRRLELDLFADIARLGPEDLGEEELPEVLAAIETALPQLQALRDRLTGGARGEAAA
ncbi:hypothetical protein [Streptomyces sp. NPDC101455]|uniref:hypothetical protein n=1 Tax=Streptomyces sp. NPDC101455 TaxID=3366142 RepID=UPI00381FBD58